MKIPNHCLNFVADSATNDWSRLRKYILLWTSSARLAIKQESEYADFSKFRDACYGVFELLQKLYDEPLGPFLSSIESAGRHHFYRIY